MAHIQLQERPNEWEFSKLISEIERGIVEHPKVLHKEVGLLALRRAWEHSGMDRVRTILKGRLAAGFVYLHTPEGHRFWSYTKGGTDCTELRSLYGSVSYGDVCYVPYVDFLDRLFEL